MLLANTRIQEPFRIGQVLLPSGHNLWASVAELIEYDDCTITHSKRENSINPNNLAVDEGVVANE